MRSPPAAPEKGQEPDARAGDGGPVPASAPPAAQPADDDDDKSLAYAGVSFSKVQNRDMFMAYDAADDHVATVRKAKANGRWVVDVIDVATLKISFKASTAARAFVLGYFGRPVE